MDQTPRDFSYQPHSFTAHAGRRAGRPYLWLEEELLRDLGSVIVAVRAVPEAFAATMGDVAYLLRHEHLDTLREAVRRVQRRP